MISSEPGARKPGENRWRVPFLALGLAGGIVGSTMSGGCGDAEEPPESEWTSESCAVKASPADVCDGLDDDGNGFVDDPRSCWDSISRYKDPASEARCWARTSDGPPASCRAYELEAEAFWLGTVSGPDRFELLQCSSGTDHVLVNAVSSERTTLEGHGYLCDMSLGFAYSPGSRPGTPFKYTCPLYRWTHEASPGNASHFFSTNETIPSSTCERPARAMVASTTQCFVGAPSGC